MNSTLTRFSPAFALAASCAAESVAQLEARQQQLDADKDEFRMREARLRSLEERLRAYQDEIRGSVGSSGEHRNVPPTQQSGRASGEAAEVAWEKLQRSAEILEAERAQTMHDRRLVHEQQLALKQRAEAVDAREAQLRARELETAARVA